MWLRGFEKCGWLYTAFNTPSSIKIMLEMVALYYKCWYYFKGNRKPWGVFKRGIKWPKLCFKSLPLEDGRIQSFRLLSLHKKYEINYGKTEISLHQRLYKSVQFVQSLSHFWLFVTPWTAAIRPPCPSPTPRVHPNSCPLSRWYHPNVSSSVVPFSFYPQSFPASGSFQMSQLFESGGETFGVSASASVLPMNVHDWSPLGWTDWVALQSKGRSRVFSNTTVQKNQFFSAQLSI